MPRKCTVFAAVFLILLCSTAPFSFSPPAFLSCCVEHHTIYGDDLLFRLVFSVRVQGHMENVVF